MSDPIKTLFGFPVVYSDKPPPLGTVSSELELVDPCEYFLVYEATCRTCGRTGLANKAMLREGVYCPYCRALLN